MLNGQAYSNTRVVYRTDTNGVLLGTDGLPGINLPRGAAVWLFANATGLPGLSVNPNSGTQYFVPNATTASLDQLIYAQTLYTTKGDLLIANTTGPARFGACPDGQMLIADVTQAQGWRCGTVSVTGAVASVFGRTGVVVAQSGDYTFAQLASKPTTLTGYGITDAVPSSRAINCGAGLSGCGDLSTDRTLTVGGLADPQIASGAAIAQSKVANLVSDLAGKAAASHTHPATDISDSTAAGRTLLTAVNAAAQRSALGLGTAAVLNVPASGNAATGEVVKGDDTRLSDARTPTAHTHAESDVTNLVSDLGAKAPTSRAINTGVGLTGGGNLTADRTIDLVLNASGGLVKNLGAGTNELGIGASGVTNAMLAGSIAYSKLSLSNSIVNADINSSAAIAYSKLNLTGSILNADLAGSIANSKLANSAITIAGTSTSLGSSITQDTITGLGSNGLVKRTGANTLAVAVSGTDYAAASHTHALSDLTQSGATTNQVPQWNGSAWVPATVSGGGGTPGGSSGQIQYNNAGAFGGVASSSVSGANVAFGGTLTVNGTLIGAGGRRKNRTATATNYTVLTSDHLVAVTDTSAARTITLPDGATAGLGAEFTITDEGGQAGANNITVQRAGSDTFGGGGTSVLVDCSRCSLTVYWSGSNWQIK